MRRSFNIKNKTEMCLRYHTIVKHRFVIFSLFVLLIFILDYFGVFTHFLEVDYGKFTYELNVPMNEILASIRKNEKVPYKPINDYPYNFKILNKDKCRQVDGNFEKVVILYVIKSALGNVKRRDTIRQSWGWENRFSDVTVRRIFMLGTFPDSSVQNDIDEESFKHKDIVQAEFVDSYYNNTIKIMMAIKWVVRNCRQAQFVMFSDDDMYVSTKNLLKFIRNPYNTRVGFRRKRDVETESVVQYAHRSTVVTESVNIERLSNAKRRKLLQLDPVLSAYDGRLFAGYVFFSSPMRHKSSKWYVPLEEYPFSKYPPYVTAGAFLLSYPALEDMHYTSLYTKHFRFDDVYLGIVAKRCGISPLHNDHFHFWKKEYDKDGYGNVIASHGYGDPEELKKVWDEQRSLGHA